MATLWAWATPTPHEHSPVDHTWVTDYDNRLDEPPENIAEVIGASENYWFCWGAFHVRGESREVSEGYLGSASGSTALATCLCASNAPSASDKPTCGTIRLYGIEGVCHQLANQVLWATGSATHPPLTVGSARGYGASTFFYGTYGLQHHAWTSRKTACGKAPTTPANGNASTAMSGSPSPNDDEFAERAATVLAKRAADNKLPALLALRRQAQEKLLGTQRETHISANALNEMHRFFLTRAATLLNDAEFADIFNVAKSDIPNVELVDPRNFDEKHSRK
jgi:hypothetical protein